MPVDTELYIAFVVAASALVLMPGPIVTLVIANSLKHGMRTGVLTSVGANTGTSILITAGGFGLTGDDGGSRRSVRMGTLGRRCLSDLPRCSRMAHGVEADD